MQGGLHLIAYKQESTLASIATASVPNRLAVTLRDDAHADVQILVRVGDAVLMGQLLARTAEAAVHAPVSGRIAAIERHGSLTFVLDNDRRDTPHDSVQPFDFVQLTPAQLRERIAGAGISGLGGACFPTATKLGASALQNAPLLIVNGAECEPFITCDDMLMRECPAEIVLGTQALLHASGATEAIIAIENNKPEALAAVSRAVKEAGDARIAARALRSFYPAGGERQLIESLTGKEVPSRGIPADIGVLCQNVGTAAAIARLVTSGAPLIQRIVTITGSGVQTRRNVRARFGTPMASLIADCGGYREPIERLIMGGSMMGVALDSDAVGVSAATNCVVAATAQDIRPRAAEMPCIRCGDCSNVCPAGLLPQQLLRYARLHDHAALAELGLRDCIECGCCDYVCPSQIPLTATFIAAKHS